MHFPRASGVLLHPTSLTGDFGIGDFGPAAFDFVDFLAEAKQAYWQVLPLGPTGFGDSPYQCFSGFAGNTLLISPEKLFAEKLLTTSDLDSIPGFHRDKVEYSKVIECKDKLLELAFMRFRSGANRELNGAFDIFCQNADPWLEDYALFRAIKNSQDQTPWFQWKTPLRLRDRGALERLSEALSEEVAAQKFYQFLFFRQWFALRDYCSENGIKIIGDVPIFVALDSADVWCDRRQFKLNEDGSPKVVAGVPPDYFSKTGQLWGNPIYEWEKQRSNGFRWWKDRIRANLRLFDILRIDHFRGFAAVWEVPGGEKTAENGSWVAVPGRELFSLLRCEFGDLPIMAEDLGEITKEVRELKNAFDFPGMKILQFAFGRDPNSLHLPHNYERNCVVYTGTHDNDTAVGWFKSRNIGGSIVPEERLAKELQACLVYFGSNGEEINWNFMRAALASVADTAIIPLQDLLGFDNSARMNLPATISGNWRWRFKDTDLTKHLCARLREMTELYGRSPMR